MWAFLSKEKGPSIGPSTPAGRQSSTLHSTFEMEELPSASLPSRRPQILTQEGGFAAFQGAQVNPISRAPWGWQDLGGAATEGAATSCS